MEKHKITMQYSSPYHHSTNGQIERQFRTIRDSIHISLKDNNFKDWEELLPEVEFMLNSTIQSTTTKSPAEIIFGKKLSREWCSSTHEIYNVDEREVKRIENQEIALDKLNNVTYDDKNRTNREFKCGDKVLVKKCIVNKHGDRYDGPGEIIEKRHDRSYLIKFSDGKIITRNVEWLRLFKQRGM